LICCLLCASLEAAEYWLATSSNWPGPWAPAYQSSPTQPIECTPASFAYIVRDNLIGIGADQQVVLKFLPGINEVDPLKLDPEADEPPPKQLLRRLHIYPHDPDQLTALRCKPPTVNQGATPMNLFKGAGWGTALLDLQFARGDGLEWFECGNLLLDANWPGWAGALTAEANGASPAYVDGFKLSALQVRAQGGRIHDVHIKNCGASGLIPWPYWTWRQHGIGNFTRQMPVTDPGLDVGRFEPDYGFPFDPDQGAWGTTEKLEGTTVWFERAPDVADDRQLKGGTLRISRSGGTAGYLDVTLRLADSGTVSRPAAYDDFQLQYASGQPVPYANGDWTARIADGQREVIVKLLPAATSQDLAEFTTHPTDQLPLPGWPTPDPRLINNVANGVNVEGDAVGGTDVLVSRDCGNPQTMVVETRAVLWWYPQSQEQVAPAVVLGTIEPTLPGCADQPGRSEALAVNSRLDADGRTTVVGTGWITPTGAPRAFVMDIATDGFGSDWEAQYSFMLNLNDPHLTWPVPANPLVSAEAINDAGWIVGNALSSGRGFVLVPQTIVSQ